jgi:hypothetical protein
MRGIIVGTKIFVIVGILLQVFTANATKRTIFDVDGPLFYSKKNSQKTVGVYGTPVKLFKIRNRPNLWVEAPNTPDVIEVSIHDLDELLTRFNIVTQQYETLLSPGEGRFGQIHQTVKLNGVEFVPGYYFIKVPESFEYFHEAPAGRNYLLEAYQKARELDRQDLGSFKGRYFDAFQELMSLTQAEADNVGVLSSRSHVREEWAGLTQEMIQDGEIKFNLDPSNIYMVGRASEHQDHGIQVDDIDTRKIELLKAKIFELADVPEEYAENVINPNGDGEARMHVLHYIENDQKIFMRAVKELRSLATMRMHGNRILVKVILSNAGDDWQVEQSRLPRHMVIGTNGVYRQARQGEISDKFFEADGVKLKKSSKTKLQDKQTGNDNLQCSELFL